MKFVYDDAFDAGTWAGTAADGVARLGEVWGGPTALLDRLEVALGLTGTVPSEVERLAALVIPVRESDGFWSASARVDPLGTAATLLRWRDTLVHAGWRGESLSPRLDQIWRLTRELPPGPDDRLALVIGTLAQRDPGVRQFSTLVAESELPRPVAEIARRLQGWGAAVRRVAIPGVTSMGDLAALKVQGAGDLALDGTVQLLRPSGALSAADAVAAWLARQPVGSVVIVSGDQSLDAALRRYGLPTSGASSPTAAAPSLQLLPLVLSLIWKPVEVDAVHQLLTLPVSPVPPTLSRRLLSALHEWPSVANPAFSDAIACYLAGVDDPSRRARQRERLSVLLSPAVSSGQPVPTAAVLVRVEALVAWLQATHHAQDNTDWAALALSQCRSLCQLLGASGLDTLNRGQLSRFTVWATSAVAKPSRFEAQSGLCALTNPGAVVSAVDTVLWWNFSLEALMPYWQPPLMPLERVALARAGVDLPDLGRQAELQSRHWYRPVHAARRRVLFVCPRFGPDGEPRHPHPLWDQLVAHLPPSVSARLVRASPLTEPALPRERVASKETPAALAIWQLGDPPAARCEESASSLRSLLGCPFQYVARYHAGLWRDRSERPARGSTMVGRVAHELFARILGDADLTPHTAEAEIAALMAHVGPSLAAELFAPGAERQRADLVRLLGRAARQLLVLLERAGLRVAQTEVALSREIAGVTVSGRLDCVLDPPAVLDFKLGAERQHADALSQGRAVQLAVYSKLLQAQSGPEFPPVAYYVLRNQRLLGSASPRLAVEEQIAGPGPELISQRLWRELAVEHERLAQGRVCAAGNLLSPRTQPEAQMALASIGAQASQQVDARDQGSWLEPPCEHCDLSVVCGRAFREGSWR